MSDFDIVVIGASAGGLNALEVILNILDDEVSTPIVIVQHLSPDTGPAIAHLLQKYTILELSEPLDKETILNHHIYLAPADYHVMIERDKSFSLSLDPKENYCRPSIDVLFETAAEVYFERTLGVILTGANKDGTKGCLTIKEFNGVVIAQDPKEALISIMPNGVIEAGAADYVLKLEEIGEMLNKVLRRNN